MILASPPVSKLSALCMVQAPLSVPGTDSADCLHVNTVEKCTLGSLSISAVMLTCLLAEPARTLHEFPVQSSHECGACLDELVASTASGQVTQAFLPCMAILFAGTFIFLIYNNTYCQKCYSSELQGSLCIGVAANVGQIGCICRHLQPCLASYNHEPQAGYCPCSACFA